MAAHLGQSGIVYFTVPGDPDLHFARRYADGRFWAANRYRGWRVTGLACKRLRPILLGAGGRRLCITLVEQPIEAAA